MQRDGDTSKMWVGAVVREGWDWGARGWDTGSGTRAEADGDGLDGRMGTMGRWGPWEEGGRSDMTERK